MKKLLGLLSTATLAGTMLLAAAPAAHAVTTTACVVTGGSVTIDNGASPGVTGKQASHSYKFVDASIACVGQFNSGSATAATYNVAANNVNPSTGLEPGSTGEDCNQGQGDGTLSATINNPGPGVHLGPANINGGFTFKRVGGLVIVTGTVTDPVSGAQAGLTGLFLFTPSSPTMALGCADSTGTTPGITNANLQGVSLLAP